MYSLRMVLGGRVDCHHLQGSRADIQELVLSACRDDHRVSLLDFLFFSSHNSLAVAGGKEEDLIDGVFLIVNTVLDIEMSLRSSPEYIPHLQSRRSQGPPWPRIANIAPCAGPCGRHRRIGSATARREGTPSRCGEDRSTCCRCTFERIVGSLMRMVKWADASG